MVTEIIHINPFVLNAPFLYPLMFSEVQRKGALGTNRLTFTLIVELNALTA